MLKIDTKGLVFYSQKDEENLFNWAKGIECIVSVERGVFTVDESRVNEISLRDLISLLFRYGLPMNQLSSLVNDQNKSWFKDPISYWHEKVFGLVDKYNEIENGTSVEEIFGYWPKFADGSITKFTLDTAKEILKLSIYYTDSGKNISAEVGLTFSGVNDMELDEVREYNVLDELVIETQDEPNSLYKIELIGCSGANGHFMCKSIEVEYINA